MNDILSKLSYGNDPLYAEAAAVIVSLRGSLERIECLYAELSDKQCDFRQKLRKENDKIDDRKSAIRNLE